MQILEWLKKKTGKFTSHDLQNEILALTVLREIVANIRGTEFFTIMMDVCTDTSNQEQASLNKMTRFIKLTCPSVLTSEGVYVYKVWIMGEG